MHALVTHIEKRIGDRETALYIAEEVLQYSRTELLLSEETNFPEETVESILAAIEQHRPLQYIFGHTQWRGMDLRVSPATLIPRPETSELVDLVLEKTDNHIPLRILDCGTGSGCIAIALKKALPQAQITGLDISTDALNIAQHNAQAQHIEVTFQAFDLLHDTLPTCDIIVSNPPYVRHLEKADMERNVLDYEPHQALFVSDNDPLLFYRRITEQHAAPILFFEINQYLGQETCELLTHLGYQPTLRKDIYGTDRFIYATHG